MKSTEIQNAAGRSRRWRWFLTLRVKCGSQRRRHVNIRNLTKLPGRHQFDVVTFMPDAFINVEQRQSQHPNWSKQYRTHRSKYAAGYCVPRGPFCRCQRIDSMSPPKKPIATVRIMKAETVPKVVNRVIAIRRRTLPCASETLRPTDSITPLPSTSMICGT